MVIIDIGRNSKHLIHKGNKIDLLGNPGKRDSIPYKIDEDFSNTKQYVFICHSNLDKEETINICNILNENKIKYWVDMENDYASKNYKECIINVLQMSQIALFLSSQNSNSSKDVHKEIAFADKNNIYILPIKLDCSIYKGNLAYDLTDIDYLNYKDENFNNKLIINIKRILGNETE